MGEKPANLFECFNKHILAPKTVVERGVELTFENKPSKEEIKRDFSKYVTLSEENAYKVYLQAQENAWNKGLEDFFNRYEKKNIEGEKARFLTENFKELDSFFMSLSQSRRTRAGGALEYIFRSLFKRLEYPFVEEPTIDGKPDFLLPNIEHYHKLASDCIIFTSKRTTRERWRQVVTEGTRGLGFYLATIDDSVTESTLADMATNRIFLVVPALMKETIERYRIAPNVLSFEAFFEDVLDPKMRQWKRSKII
jgi:hypothetical protein